MYTGGCQLGNISLTAFKSPTQLNNFLSFWETHSAFRSKGRPNIHCFHYCLQYSLLAVRQKKKSFNMLGSLLTSMKNLVCDERMRLRALHPARVCMCLVCYCLQQFSLFLGPLLPLLRNIGPGGSEQMSDAWEDL